MNYQLPLSETVRVAQKVVIINPDINKFLLLFRKKSSKSRPGDFDLPGSNLAPHENHEDSLRREVMEETGLQIKQILPVFLRSSSISDNGIYFLYIGFAAQALNTEVVLDSEEEIDSYKWLTLNEFESMVAPDNKLHQDILIQVKRTFKFFD